MADEEMKVTRYHTAQAFLDAAQPVLMMAEAENNLMIGIAQAIARNPSAATSPYLATAGTPAGVLACAVHVPIGLARILREALHWREPAIRLAAGLFALLLLVLGLRSVYGVVLS